MNFTVFSSAPLVKKQDGYYAYQPYIREMDLWARHTGPMHFACPVIEDDGGLYTKIEFPIGRIYELHAFDVQSAAGVFRALRYSIVNLFILFGAMRAAGHLHLRCPGNIGLLACVVQIFFPGKKKTAKYAGNWDPKSVQPVSYKVQKWFLNNAFLTRNMTVLVYGQWPGTSRNIKPFFTATYWESDKKPLQPKPAGPIAFVFAGSLAPGKRPQYAIELVERLRSDGVDAYLNLYGNGSERAKLEDYVKNSGLIQAVRFMGNQPANAVARAFGESHFAILPSRSEGWPKAVAEAMFWGCLPLATAVSCVPYMLDSGKRGVLLSLDLEADAKAVIHLLENPMEYQEKVEAAANWSRQFTLDLFEREIVKLL